MSYIRVIPRDLFNEANLLKCLGQIYLNLEKLNIPGVSLEHDGESFDIIQNPNDGSISVDNITLWKGELGHSNVNISIIYFSRPLNSRDPWPLITSIPDENDNWNEINVFNPDGTFSELMIEFLKGE